MFCFNTYCMPFYHFYWTNGDCSTGELFLLWTEEELLIFDENIYSSIHIPAKTLLIASKDFLKNHNYQGALLGVGLGGTLVTDFISTFSEGYRTMPCRPTLFFQIYEGEFSLQDMEKSVLSYEILCRSATFETTEEKVVPILVVAAMEEIHLNYRGIFGVEELATTLEVSKSHLIRTFQKAMGITPGKYLVKVRLESAKRALQQNLSLDLVAEMNGFSSAGYFCKVFKKETGETPSQWKNKNSTQSLLKAKDAFEEELLLYL